MSAISSIPSITQTLEQPCSFNALATLPWCQMKTCSNLSCTEVAAICMRIYRIMITRIAIFRGLLQAQFALFFNILLVLSEPCDYVIPMAQHQLDPRHALENFLVEAAG